MPQRLSKAKIKALRLLATKDRVTYWETNGDAISGATARSLERAGLAKGKEHGFGLYTYSITDAGKQALAAAEEKAE